MCDSQYGRSGTSGRVLQDRGRVSLTEVDEQGKALGFLLLASLAVVAVHACGIDVKGNGRNAAFGRKPTEGSGVGAVIDLREAATNRGRFDIGHRHEHRRE